MASGPAVAILFAVALVVFTMKGINRASSFIISEDEKARGRSRWKEYDEADEEEEEWEEEVKTASVRRRSR